MIVQSNAIGWRLPIFSCGLSARKRNPFYSNSIPRRHGYAFLSSNSRRGTILQDISNGPASTCWSLLSPSSSVIASNIGSLKLRKAKIPFGKTPLVVLLVTPAHIRLLDDDSTFIPSLLRLAVETTKPWQDFDLLAAVIDGIPQTWSTAPYRLRGSHSADVDSVPKTRMERGFEGISVAVLDSETAAPDLWSPKDMFDERETMTIQQRCTLSFSLPPSPGVRTQLSENSASQPLVKRILQLPVTNTLFQNGKTSTLFSQRWNVQRSEESISEHVCSKKTWLPQQIVQMGAVFADEGMRLQLDHLVHSLLMPITPARTITAAVGNIVRKISGGDALAEAAPASEELERAISTAIQQGQIPAQQAGVWALIRPQRYAALDRAAQIQGTVRERIQYAVLSGGRLHKVLSGGGGWGEKHGLLALDPDSDYSHHHRALEPSFGDDQDVETRKREALGEVAKPGDTITFYVYKSLSDADPANLDTPVFSNSNQAAAATLIFGSLPSTMDAMPVLDTTEVEAHAQSELTVEENHFGMLSEQGMSLETSFINTNITANRMQYLKTELYRQAYEVRRKNTVTTKLDAPYTLLSIRGQASKVPVSGEVKGEELQAPNVRLQDLMPQEPSTPTSTSKYNTALVQKVPKLRDQKQEVQRLIGPGFMQAKLNSRRIAEAKFQSERYPKISENVARKIAKKAAKKAVNNRNKGKTDDGTRFTVRFTSQEQKPSRQVILQPEAQDAPGPITIKRHFSLGPGNDYQRHGATPEQKPEMKTEPISASKPFADDVKYRNQQLQSQGSVPIIREESEGKDPGTACKGKYGNVFMLRKHATMNPFERLQAIQQVGEITSRDQAMGLHSQYHLPLFDEQQEGV